MTNFITAEWTNYTFIYAFDTVLP